MDMSRFRFDGSKKCKLQDIPTDSRKAAGDKKDILKKYEKNLIRLSELQHTFYSYRKEGLVIVLQAMDAAGKDSLIRHVASSMNPQGVSVCCLKRPSPEELEHDYLWRINKALPRRGEITIYNRSYYEDIVTADVKHLMKTYPMADRIINVNEDKFISKRIDQVNHFEEYLYENSYRIIKIFLHLSKETQKKRLLERIELKEKNWKFEKADLDERKVFDTYLDKYENVINKTATEDSPWFVIPADDKWYTRYIFSEILITTFKKIGASPPTLSAEETDNLQTYRDLLENE